MKRTWLSLALLLALLSGLLWAGPAPTRAATQHIVNDAGDKVDYDLNDGTCDTGDPVFPGPPCTLRAAIQQANHDADPDTTITFDIGTGFSGMTIKPLTALPTISETITIDASSAWSPTFGPRVTLDGSNAIVMGSQLDSAQALASGLILNASNCEVYGLYITGFQTGIRVLSDNNKIGGTGTGQGNVFANNSLTGVHLNGPGAYENVVQGNLIGLNPYGTEEAPNYVGVTIDAGANHNTIGGDSSVKGNHISGNMSHGVQIKDATTDWNYVGGNTIGLPAVGSTDVGNGADGVHIENGAERNHVGSPISNTISFNGGAGVWITGSNNNHVDGNTIQDNGLEGTFVYSSTNTFISGNTITGNTSDGVRIEWATAIGNQILANSIYDNDGKGIELINGGNTELAAPTITSASASGAAGTACASCAVQVYSDKGDEGEIWHASVLADGSGNWTYSGALTGPNVTALNTDGPGNTSEFSTPYAMNQAPNTPSSPSPTNGATGVALSASLSWTGGDPDAGDTVTYDVHFGTTTPPPLVQSGQSATTYQPTLAARTHYYWKIVAKDNHGATTSGDQWAFTTGKMKVFLPMVTRNP